MVSVCMATFNGELYIKEQIDSILIQLEDDDELIISDDGSTDNTRKIIKEYEDKRIRLLYNNAKCYTSNFENALKHAKGDYIFIADQDDVWIEGKVAIISQLLKKYDFVVSDASVTDGELNIIQESRNRKFKIKNGFWRNWMKTYCIGCCMAFTKEVLECALPFPNNRDLCRHDAWILMVAEMYFHTYVCGEKLVLYRRHGKNASSGAMGITNSVKRMIQIRLYLLYHVLKRRKGMSRY